MNTLFLNECHIDVLNYGKMDDENYCITQICFYDNYYLATEGETIGEPHNDKTNFLYYLENHFVVFEINYN